MGEFESKIQPKMYCLGVGKGSWEKRKVGKVRVEKSEVDKFQFKLESTDRL